MSTVILPEIHHTEKNLLHTIPGSGYPLQKPITSSIKNDFGLPPVEDFESLIGPKTKGIILCNPNNPTGYLYTRNELEHLSELIKEYDLYLFSDEVYREFCYDGETHFSAMNLKGLEQHVVLLDSVSKRYSMCGVRVGALISRNVQVMHTAMKFAQARLCPPSYGQIAAEAALETPPEYFREVYNEYIERRNFMVKALNDMPGVYCPTPKGAFYTVASFPIDDAEHFCQWMLTDFNYKGQTVMMAPASGFYSTHGLGKNECRIAYVLKIDELHKAMETLAEGLKQYPGRIK